MKTLPVPSVDVVIVNHNADAYVVDAIHSVASQTVGRFQAIVVDDASTDQSARVIQGALEQLGDARFRYLPLSKNVGQAGAARQGLAELTSPFVCFLDSDDVWYENFLERHLAVHLNTDFPVGLTYCDAHFIDGKGQMLAGTAWWFGRLGDNPEPRAVDPAAIPIVDGAKGVVHPSVNGRLTLYEDWSTSWSSNSTSSMMFRRALVDLVLSVPDADLRLYMDTYLSTFATLLSGAIAIDDALYAYRMHGSNQHSNGAVLGGTAPTSQKDWGPIYERILDLVHRELTNRPDAITRLVDPARYNKAVHQVSTALAALREPPTNEKRGLLATLRRLIGYRA